MSGTASRDARTAGKSVWSKEACHSASLVSTIPAPFATPTLLTRMSRPPNVSTVLAMTVATPSAVARSAVTANNRAEPSAPPIAVKTPAPSASAPSPRAQIVTRHPSSTSARAEARPRPLLDPVTMAIRPLRSRSISSAIAGLQDCRIAEREGLTRKKENAILVPFLPAILRFRNSPMSTSAAAGQIVERPVERCKADLKRVLGEQFLFRRQQLRQDEGHNRALDRAAVRKRCRRLVAVHLGKLLRAPRENRACADLPAGRVDRDALRSRHALGGNIGELLLEPCGGERLAAQPSAAHRAAAERKVSARIVERRKDCLLDLIERQAAPGDPVLQPLEGA